MEPTEKFSLNKRIRSFKYAFNGLWEVVLREHNFRIHLLAAGVAVYAGFYFNISGDEWIAIILVIAMVWSFEIVNAAIEKLCDVVLPREDKRIKLIKDMAAAAVLLAAIASLVVAAIIFIPKVRL